VRKKEETVIDIEGKPAEIVYHR